MERQRRIDRLIAVFYFGTMFAVACLCYRFLVPALFPFLIALSIASQLKKLTRFFTRHSGARGRVAAAASVLCFYGVVGMLLWVLLAYGFSFSTRMLTRLPELYSGAIRPAILGARDEVRRHLTDIAPELVGDADGLFDIILAWLGDLVGKFSSGAMDWLGSLIGHLPEMMLGAVFTVVLTFLITSDYQNIVVFILRQMPRDFRQTFIDLKDFLFSTLYSLLKAYVIIIMCSVTLLAVGLSLLQVPGSIRLAVLIAVMDILPVLGSGMVFLPWAAYCLITGDVALGIGLIILFALMETLRSFIEPHIVGDQIGLHPVATIVSSFIGLKFMGFGGIIIAPILALTAKHLNEKNILRVYK